MRAALALLAGGALAGCSLITDSFVTNEFSGDPFPIHVGRESGAVLIGLRKADGPDLVAVLDVLSPVTVTDPGLESPQTIGTSDLLLVGRGDPAIDAFDVPRARLRGAEVISLHPCTERDGAATCLVGTPDAPQQYGAIIGANALAGDALRLRLGDGQVFLLADVGGKDRDRTFVCDAVFPAPYRGGGTLVIAGTEVAFGGRRIALQACLGADPDPAHEIPQSERGGDALLVASTGVGVSLLGEAAYERYRLAASKRTSPPPPLEALPGASVLLPSGPVDGKRATIDRLALAAASSSSPRAPCRQAYAHHLLLPNNCDDGDDCPCTDKKFCAVPAIVELAPPGGIEVLVIPDANATLQALRAELRPDQPEVDGILGADALALAEVDVDYPNNRMLVRCAPGSTACRGRPALAAKEDRKQVNSCVNPAAP
jgi:hypothetical protein